MITFEATVRSRTRGEKTEGPPGESDVLLLNPKRQDLILKKTGWEEVFPGTLNLKVSKEDGCRILSCKPVIYEKGEDIVYPQKYVDTPNRRGAYLYYWARIIKDDKVAHVLIRRACNPHSLNSLEAVSEKKLRDALLLKDGDNVICEVGEIAALESKG